MRAVLDPNVVISALLSPRGAPALVVLAWQSGDLELVISPKLLAELRRALDYPKLRTRVDPADAAELIAWLERSAIVADDPASAPAIGSQDPDDDYLVALAERERAALVSGDRHLLALAGELPVFASADFLALLRRA